MKISTYIRAERCIAAADEKGVLARWRWGRAVLADPEVTNPSGSLRCGRGVVEQLVHAARARGLQLSEREIRRRLQCARTYSSEDALSGLVRAGYATWTALAAAGFPAVDDPMEPALIDRDGHVDPAAAPWHQPPLDDGDGIFPRVVRVAGVDHDRDQATLRLLETYLDGCERWTAAHVRRNERMRARLAQLVEAAGGDLEVRYGDVATLELSDA